MIDAPLRPAHGEGVPAPVEEYVRYRIEPGQAAAFQDAYALATASLEASPYSLDYSLDYSLSRCTEEPQRFILRILWTSQEDHEQRFRKSEVFGEFLGHVRPYIGCIEEMQHYVPTPIRRRRSIYAAVGGAETFFRIAHRMHKIAIARYFDWGTGIAVANSKPGHEPDVNAGVPTWGFDA